ncbi:hypothetical protein L1987_13910 [Smallanthus sonchifolius]|uniref:Uncharacterized protein n=1 Tax=Smallanthus sonchifolius TaxID=185202 RepID=A0ACB9JIN4_9ASTR|nr:hypothetical protein L1987_13910 [Smallanthus sonchifolius]
MGENNERKWEEPKRRHNKGKNADDNGGSGVSKGVVKFYISNLPDGSTPWEISQVMGAFGDLGNVYIARKRDKMGNKFGFATYRKVVNSRELEKNLQRIKIGGNRLFVNVAKFAAENERFMDKSRADTRRRANDNPDWNTKATFALNLPSGGGSGWGKTFKDALTNQGAHGGNSEMESRKEDSNSIFIPEEAAVGNECYNRSLVGRSNDLKTLNDLNLGKVWGAEMAVNIQYIGGLSVLISYKDESSAKDYLKKEEVWCKLFSSLKMWNGQSLPYERIAWLKCHGIPFFLTGRSVLESIGSRFGKVVHVPELFLEDKDLSSVCIGILVGEGSKICDSVTLKWKNKSFKVWLSEEMGDWIPECLIAPATYSPAEDEEVEEGEFRGEEFQSVGVNGESNFAADKTCIGGMQSVSVSEEHNGFCMGRGKDDFKTKKIKERKHGPGYKCQGKVYDEPEPKKRIRASMEDDPFNLNALLGLIDARPKSVDGSKSNRYVPSFEEFLGFDFDLNTRASDNSCSAESGEQGLADTTSEGNGSTDIGSPAEAPASLVEEKEIKDTIEIGCLTGVNLF